MTVRSLAAAMLVSSMVSPSPTAGQEGEKSAPRRERGPRVVSPEVSPERRITFRVHAPRAEAVRLTGSDIPAVGRGKDMTKGAEGVWEVTLDPVDPGAYRYRFDIDGVPVMDPTNPASSESNSNAWSLVHVPGSELMDQRDVPHGAVAEVVYHSGSLGRPRRMHVYTPPGYESGTEKYPVFYLLHGASDCDDSWTSVGRAGFILDNLIAARKAKPMVVVMPAGHTGPFRMGPRAPDAPRPAVDEFGGDFLKDIMPHVEKNYRVLTDRKHRAIAGLSMGGGQTLNIAIPNLEKFGYFGVFSSGVFGITGGRGGPGGAGRAGSERAGPSWEERHKDVLDDAELKKGLELVWFATGKEDFLIETSRATVAMLEKHKFDVVFKETGGGHTWLNWRQYLIEFAALLFADGATARARAIGKEGNDVKDGKDAGDGTASPPPARVAAPDGFDVRREGAPQGRIETVEYDSKSIGMRRRMVVYTPAGYGDGRKLPVLYLLHGIGDDEEHWQEKGSAGAILDNLHAEGKVQPMVVVMPNGRAAQGVTARTPWNEQFPAFAAFEKDLIEDVIPFIEARYSVKGDRKNRALAGLSMGGGQSLNFGLSHLDTFAWVGGFSSAPNTKRAAELIPDPDRARRDLALLWLSCGDEDGLMRVSRAFHDALEERKIAHTWHVGSGGHAWPVWKSDLYFFSQKLFR